jgi:hypothetical protein
VLLVLEFQRRLGHSLLAGKGDIALGRKLRGGDGVFVRLERGVLGSLVRDVFRVDGRTLGGLRGLEFQRHLRGLGLGLCLLTGEVTGKENRQNQDESDMDDAGEDEEKGEPLLSALL